MLADISAFFEETVVVWILAIAGALFLTAGATSLRRVLVLRSRGVRVPGRITGSRISTSSEDGISIAAEFEFTTADGRYVHTHQPISTSSNRLRPGGEVTVAYDEHDPERAEIIEAGTQISGAVAFTAIGVAQLAASAIALKWHLG